jgi:hypothetical protein
MPLLAVGVAHWLPDGMELLVLWDCGWLEEEDVVEQMLLS